MGQGGSTCAAPPRVRGVALEVEGVRSVDSLAGGRAPETPQEVARLDMGGEAEEGAGDEEQEGGERGGGEAVLAREGRHCSCLRLLGTAVALLCIVLVVARGGVRACVRGVGERGGARACLEKAPKKLTFLTWIL